MLVCSKVGNFREGRILIGWLILALKYIFRNDDFKNGFLASKRDSERGYDEEKLEWRWSEV